MCISRNVARINENAVSSLIAGDYQKSLSISRVALGMLRNVRQNAPTRENFFVLKAKTFHDYKLRVRSALLPNSRGTTCEENTGAFEIFNRALLLEHEELCQMESTRQDITVAVVVLYNSGLCHHLRGLQHGNSKDIATAAKMYTSAYCILAGPEMIPYEQDALLMLAILNNLGHIYQNCLCEYTQAWDCLSALNECLASIEEGDLSDDEYIFFSMASGLGMSRNFIATPAA